MNKYLVCVMNRQTKHVYDWREYDAVNEHRAKFLCHQDLIKLMKHTTTWDILNHVDWCLDAVQLD